MQRDKNSVYCTICLVYYVLHIQYMRVQYCWNVLY